MKAKPKVAVMTVAMKVKLKVAAMTTVNLMAIKAKAAHCHVANRVLL